MKGAKRPEIVVLETSKKQKDRHIDDAVALPGILKMLHADTHSTLPMRKVHPGLE